MGPQKTGDITDDVSHLSDGGGKGTLGSFSVTGKKHEIEIGDWVYDKIQFPPVLQSIQLEKDFFMVCGKTRCFLYVSYSMARFINTVYL